MRTHTSNFKNQIKLLGREIDSKITYRLNNIEKTLTSEQINSVVPTFQGKILKSVMKELDIDSNVDIPKKTILNFKFGLKINDNYEYLDFGNYVVHSSEKLEDTNSYKIVCYDKLLYSMTEYRKLNITYPISIRNYLNAICSELGIEFADNNKNFANYDKMIANELYLDNEGNSLGYTFRDILDELSQVTASNICINNQDELEVRYISETSDEIDEEFFKDTNVIFGKKYGPIDTIVLSRSADSDSIHYPEVLPEITHEIKIKDNQIMNFNNRSEFLPDIYEKLNGLEFYLNDYSSKGICYYELCDRYSVKIGENVYSCVLFNDEINITQGLEENVYTEEPEEAKTDYTKANKDDRHISLIVDKQLQEIKAEVKETTTKITNIEKSVPKYQTELDIYNITISVDSELKPLENKDYSIGYTTKFEGSEVESTVSSQSENTGITFGLSNNKITLSVLTSTAIASLSNEFVIDFSYTKDNTSYTDSKKIVVTLALKGNTGSKGDTGANGKDGTNGVNGKDGTSYYVHIRYSINSNGNPMTESPSSSSKYMGIASTTSSTAPTSYSSYKWSLIKGADGTSGKDGTDGKNSYLHIKYSNDGATFTSNNGNDVGRYIGSYSDYNETASTNFDDYSWQDTAIVVDDELDDLQNQINNTNKDLNNNYTNNTELDRKLEDQKQTITEEFSTKITQTKSEWQASVIEYINTNGVEKFVNTLVTIDIDGLKLSKSDEDIVSLLNNKGLYVSDGKLREDLANLLMKVDRAGAYLKLLEILGTIKEQGIIQKEKIADETFGKCQAWYWIGDE